MVNMKTWFGFVLMNPRGNVMQTSLFRCRKPLLTSRCWRC